MTVSVVAGLAATALVFLACLGAGAMVLRCTGVLSRLSWAERLVLAFALGLGGVGWIGFLLGIAGLIGALELAADCIACASGIWFLRRPRSTEAAPPPLDPTGWALCAAIATVLAFGVLQGVSPPTDADSLAYHYALPKSFFAAGRIVFVPRAIDGAAPLLVQTSYLFAYGLGGEVGLTLWSAVSGWMAAALVYVLARRYLSVNWSLAVALIFLTTPAVIYGAGSGQVETRLAMFALAAAFATAQALRSGALGYAALAGVAAGFYFGGKFTGALFGVACASVLLARRGWAPRLAIYGLAAFVAGAQWYGWNWYHTGDPFFPVLFQALNLPDGQFWNSEQDEIFRRFYYGAENWVPADPFWFFAYPIRATLFSMGAFESGRTGLGPFALLVLPFAVAGSWRFRSRLRTSPLTVLAAIALVFYGLWFFSATSQRVRHLLPVYPLALICLAAAAARWADRPARRLPLVAATALTVAIQLGAQTLYGLNFAHHVFSREQREEFLLRTVSRYQPVPWINRTLAAGDKILVLERQLVFLLDVPLFFAHPVTQATVEMRLSKTDPAKFLGQLRREGVTHLLMFLDLPVTDDGWSGDLTGFANLLQGAGCAKLLRRFDVTSRFSRTLGGWRTGTQQMGVVALTDPACPM